MVSFADVLQYRSNDKKTVLIVDMGSATVGVALAIMEKGRPPRILYATREWISKREYTDAKELKWNFLNTIEVACLKAEEYGLPLLRGKRQKNAHLDHILCIFDSPWYEIRSRTIDHTTKSTVVITQEILDNLLEQLNGEKSQKKKEETKDTKHMVVESKVVKVALNGYEVPSPVGKKAKHIEITSLEVTVSKELHRSVAGILEKVFSGVKVDFHSFTLVAFDSIRVLLQPPERYAIMEITGAVTDFSIVDHGKIIQTASIPQGHIALVKHVAGALHVDMNEATEKVLRMQGSEKDGSKDGVLESSLLEAKKIWLTGAMELLAKVSEFEDIPDTFYALVDPRLETPFLDALKGDLYAQMSLTHREPIVETFKASQVNRLVLYEHNALRDMYLALETLFFSRNQNT